MIGIICAMSEERDALLSLMSDVKKEKGKNIMYHGMPLNNTYFVGKLEGKDIVLAHSGVGKVYAAIVTTNIIFKYKPELIINLGCAGSLNSDIHVGDTVVGTRVADWDVDVPGWTRSIQSDKMSYACDGKFNKIVSKLKTKHVIKQGYIVSADEFIYKKTQVNTIKRYFKDALCGEMEGSSIACTCYAYQIPVAIIRTISDETLINGNYKNFDFNLNKVCKTSAKLCAMIIKRY